MNNKQTLSALYYISMLFAIFLITSCKGDEMIDPCEGIEDTGNSFDFKGETYEVNEYNYSDVVLTHNFSFKSYFDDCSDSLSVFLQFGKVLSFPDFSLAGDYTTIYSLETFQVLDEGMMLGSYTFSGEKRQNLISDQIVTVSESDDGASYIFAIDGNTNAVFGESDVMQFNATVPKE